MKMLNLLLLLIIMCANTAWSESRYKYVSESDAETEQLLIEMSRMFKAAQVVIFKNLPIINSTTSDKESLFGDSYIKQVKSTYSSIFKEPFPKNDHFFKEQLIASMVDVMEENRTLITDTGIKFKGLIPATYASQLSYKFSNLRLGIVIKFTAPMKLLRDQWEVNTIEKFLGDDWRKNEAFYEASAILNDKPAFRYMTPLYHSKMCLGCHGMPADNPKNKNKPEAEWTKIDTAGFPMDGQLLGQLGGGISVSILK
jgi:hypothetical protein